MRRTTVGLFESAGPGNLILLQFASTTDFALECPVPGGQDIANKTQVENTARGCGAANKNQS